MSTIDLDAHWLRKISVESFTDPRSVLRFIRGESIRPTTRARLSQAFERLGLDQPVHRRHARRDAQ